MSPHQLKVLTKLIKPFGKSSKGLLKAILTKKV